MSKQKCEPTLLYSTSPPPNVYFVLTGARRYIQRVTALSGDSGVGETGEPHGNATSTGFGNGESNAGGEGAGKTYLARSDCVLSVLVALEREGLR